MITRVYDKKLKRKIVNKYRGITPIGETNYDNKVKENLNTIIEIVNH